jgi:hypothetical protein
MYKVPWYPLSLVSVFGLKGDKQQSLNDRLGSLSNLKLKLLKHLAEDWGSSLTCSTRVICCYIIRIKFVRLLLMKF